MKKLNFTKDPYSFIILGGAKPSYGGGGKGFDIPKLNIPNPIDFKAGVLR